MKKLILTYHKLSEWIEPETVFTTLFSEQPTSFWLDSSLINDTNRFSYMGIPSEIVTYDLPQNIIAVAKNNKTEYIHGDIFTYLNEQLKNRACETTDLPFDFTCGYIGYFGYELKALCGGKATYRSSYPDSLWFFTDKTVVFDHKEKEVYLVSISTNEAQKWFKEIQNILTIPRNPSHPPFIKGGANSSPTEREGFQLARNHGQYLKDIAACKRYLENGESYQICLTNTISAELNIEPLMLYKNLRKTNPAPYSAFIKYYDIAVLCSSPEQFLKIDKNRKVSTKPIKGTVRRGKTPEEDIKLAEQLAQSKKDWSENAMIVDLLRNDLGKVCEFGTVKVTDTMKIESYTTVHQLVSTIRGKLQKDKTLIDCVQACFPGGSMTGCPKIKTMEILDILEQQARGIYSGALGYLSLDQTAELNIVIRTIVAKGKNLSIGAGGAILTDSVPEKEYDEMLLKAQVLMETINNQ